MQAIATAGSLNAVAQPLCQPSRRGPAVACHAWSGPIAQQQVELDAASRRHTLLSLAAGLAGASLQAALPQLASAATTVVAVDTYLPADPDRPGFCIYTPDAKKTPAIRAGVIKPEPNFYKLALPSSWTEAPLTNPLTGNFCMPRCEEPWYEFKFEDPKEGTVQLIVTELQKLGAKPSATTKDLGPPELLIPRIGNLITGSFVPDEEDVVSAEAKQNGDGRSYNYYEIFTPYSKSGAHSLAAFTTKSGLAYLLTVSASDKQWGTAQSKLRSMLESFQA